MEPIVVTLLYTLLKQNKVCNLDMNITDSYTNDSTYFVDLFIIYDKIYITNYSFSQSKSVSSKKRKKTKLPLYTS